MLHEGGRVAHLFYSISGRYKQYFIFHLKIWGSYLMFRISQRVSLAVTVGAILAVSGITNINAKELSPSDFQAVNAAVPREASPKSGVRGQSATSVFIVRLTEPSLASYRGGIPGMKGTSRSVTGERKLNTKSSAARKYGKYLQDRQSDVLARGAQKMPKPLPGLPALPASPVKPWRHRTPIMAPRGSAHRPSGMAVMKAPWAKAR